MRGADLYEIMTTIIPHERLLDIAHRTGFAERERKIDVANFLSCMVMAASTGEGGRFAAVFRRYFESDHAKPVVRAALYKRIGVPLESALREMFDDALAFSGKQQVDLPGWLGEYVKDWHIVDSTEVRLNDSPELKRIYSGKGDYAAVKVNKRMSVGTGILVNASFSAAREHDSRHFEIDESWTGLGLLADLAYVSIANLVDCELYDVKYVLRLKENWKPKVDSISRGAVAATFFPGTDLQTLIDDEVILLDGRVIDALVRIGPDDKCASARLVGVPDKKSGKYHFYLTNLPRAVGPRQVSDLYRVRWEIEISNRVDKSILQLDEIEADKITSVHCLLYASLISSIMIHTMVHRHRQQEKARNKNRERTSAPLHAGRLGLMLAACAMRVADMLAAGKSIDDESWERTAAKLVMEGRDPNWRNKPSVLDQLRGWTIPPRTTAPKALSGAA